jgi:enolase
VSDVIAIHPGKGEGREGEVKSVNKPVSNKLLHFTIATQQNIDFILKKTPGTVTYSGLTCHTAATTTLKMTTPSTVDTEVIC